MEKTENPPENGDLVYTGTNYVAIVSIVGSVVESIVYGIAIGAGYQRNIGFGASVGIALLKTVSDNTNHFFI